MNVFFIKEDQKTDSGIDEGEKDTVERKSSVPPKSIVKSKGGKNSRANSEERNKKAVVERKVSNTTKSSGKTGDDEVLNDPNTRLSQGLQNDEKNHQKSKNHSLYLHFFHFCTPRLNHRQLQHPQIPRRSKNPINRILPLRPIQPSHPPLGTTTRLRLSSKHLGNLLNSSFKRSFQI